MCEPSTIMMVTTGVLMAAGTAMSMQQAGQQQRAQRDQANYKAALAQNNAAIQKQNADRIKQQGERDAAAQRRKGAMLVGKQRSLLAARGIDIGSGSALQVQADAAAAAEADAQEIRNNAANKAHQYRMSAYEMEHQSILYSHEASQYSPGKAMAMEGIQGATRLASMSAGWGG